MATRCAGHLTLVTPQPVDTDTAVAYDITDDTWNQHLQTLADTATELDAAARLIRNHTQPGLTLAALAARCCPQLALELATEIPDLADAISPTDPRAVTAVELCQERAAQLTADRADFADSVVHAWALRGRGPDAGSPPHRPAHSERRR